MNFKKLAVIGAVALVVIGCVLVAGCTSTQQSAQTTTTPGSTGITPVVGQWISNFTNNGETYTAVQTIKANGTGYWMRLADNTPGIQLRVINKSTFDKIDGNGNFTKVSSDGNTYKLVYDPVTKTITQDGRNVYSKINPIVGIWSGIDNFDSNKTTTIINPDGTGVYNTLSSNGVVEFYTFKWTQNNDGTYNVDFHNGDKRIYSVDSTGTVLTSSSGNIKHKELLESTYLVSICGTWYDKGTDVSVIFNADGSGTFNGPKYGLKTFNWTINPETGNFVVTYNEGKSEYDGSDVKGKTFKWTYNREKNTFTDGNGITYLRPTESVTDKIIIS